MKIRNAFVVAVMAACLGACSAEKETEEVPRKTAAELLVDLEAQLMVDSSLAFTYEITAEGAVDAAVSGRFSASWPDVTLTASGEFAGNSIDLGLDSAGDEMKLSFGQEKSGPRPEELRDALVIGLVRMGLLHNIAVLTGGGAPDHADGGVRDWVELHDVEDVEDRADGGRVIGFSIRVAGKPAGTARLELDAMNNPLRREQTVQFPQGEMRVTETYRY